MSLADVELYPVASIDKPHPQAQRVAPFGRRFKSKVGERYGDWEVVGISGHIGKYIAYVVECVNCSYTREVRSNTLYRERTGASKGCNCISSTNHDLHAIWAGMHQRCTNPKVKHFDRYGGRGITVCERWKRFHAFVEDMGERPSKKHSIDRIDNDGNYEPGNCRWATYKEQSHNSTHVRHITFNGETMVMSEWADRLGITRERMRQRLNCVAKGTRTLEEALTAPKGVVPPTKIAMAKKREREVKSRQKKALEKFAEIVGLIDGQVHVVELDDSDPPPAKVVDAIRSLSADCTTRIIDNCVMFKATPSLANPHPHP